jgi:hypothetical protein
MDILLVLSSYRSVNIPLLATLLAAPNRHLSASQHAPHAISVSPHRGIATGLSARMDLGVRQIRTAGKGSGSVELTLPGSLRQLVGLRCRMILHDGALPEIVMRPDLTAATAAFAALWRALAQCFARDLAGSPADRFPAQDFSFTLAPGAVAATGPLLSWQDGLALAARHPDPSAFGRAVAACAVQLGGDLGIAAALRDAFGAACGFLAAGRLVFAEWHLPRDLAAAHLAAAAGWAPGAPWAASPDIHAEHLWSRLGPGLAACATLFATWSLPGSPYPALCAAWHRGRSIELNRG